MSPRLSGLGTGVVKQSPGAIGYVELSYAEENHPPVVLMQNQAEKYVALSAESASAAIDAFKASLLCAED